MRFVHTADWQIGMRCAHLGEAGGRAREERLRAAERVVALARDENAEFIALTGDVFEDNGVDRALVQRVWEVLASFRAPVFVIPGNHDPLVPGSVWDHPCWRSAGEIRVLRTAEPVVLPSGAVLYPCPAFEKHSDRDPTAWIDARGATHLSIGLAHGSVEGIRTDKPDYPIARDAAIRAGLDFLALGHWHSAATYPDAEGSVRMAYSGTHETASFGERDSGHALVVDIDHRGAPAAVRRVRTGGLHWETLAWDLRVPGDVAALRAAVEALESPGDTVLRVKLSGLLHASDREEIFRLAELCESRFLFARLDATDVRPAPDDQGWVDALPPGLIRETAERLRTWADPEARTQRPEGATPDVALAALLRLYELASEGSKGP